MHHFLFVFLYFKTKLKVIKNRSKKIIIAFSVLLLLILLTVVGIRYYVNRHKKEIATLIENAINDHSRGSIVFDSIYISSIKDLPNINFQIHNLKLVDSLYAQHKRKTVFLENISASISIIDMLRNEIKINSVSAKKGQINIFTDKNHYTNTYVFRSEITKKDKKDDYQIMGNDVDVIIEDIDFIYTEKIKNKRITAHLNTLDFKINLKRLTIPTLDLDIFMKEMGLNLEKGTFFNNVRCIGTIHPKIDDVNKTIEVPEFPLEIGKQEFDVSAFFNTKEKRYRFLLSLDKANFNQTLSLMPDNIKSKLTSYSIQKPFKVKADISGIFAYKNNPLVKLEYATQKNEVIFQNENIHLKEVTFSGALRNRIYFDDRMKIENEKNLTINFDRFTGIFKNMPFQLSHFGFINEFSKPIHIKTDFKVKSKIKNLNELIKSPDYDFINGKFSINGKLNGYVSTLSDVFKFSKFHVESKDLLVKSKHTTNQFHLPYLELEVNQNNAEIKNAVVQFNANERAQLQGNIKNFSTFFTVDNGNKPVISTLNVSSNYLNYNSILRYFGAQKKQTESKNLRDIKESFKTLAGKFNPNVSFSLQRLDFSETLLEHINIIARYENKVLKIDEISGNYKDGSIRAKLDIDLKSRKNNINEETLFLDLLLEVNGKIEHWLEILKSKNFFFKKAKYKLNAEFYGETKNLKGLIEKSKIVMNVQKGEMLYKPSDLILPFNNISLTIQNKNAFLNDFELKLPHHQTIHLKGKLDNFMKLFDSINVANNVKSSISVFSKHVDFSNFVEAFITKNKPKSKKNNIKIILKDLNAKFKPSVFLQIDSLTYKKLTLVKVNANMHFKDLNILEFNKVYGYYYNKKVTLNAQMDLSDKTQTHFATNLTVDDVAIERLLETFDNFGYAKLNKPTEVTGIINIKGFFKGLIDDVNGLKFNTIEAKMQYNIKNLRVKNFKPIIDVGNKFFRKERFEDLKFANIKNSLSIKHKVVELPQTNVQSTAFDFFIEGDIDNSYGTNLWVSIPLSNIKRRDLSKIPINKTFEEGRRKVYLEIKSDKKGKLLYKFHLTNKKHLTRIMY